MADPEADLLRRAGAGDQGAFLVLYERHRRPVFRFVYRMLGSVPLAEDLTHECFLALLTHPDRFDPGRASLRTFLCAIGRNLSLKQLRRRGVEIGTGELPEPEPSEPSQPPGPLQELLEGERRTAVQQAVGALPPLQREVLILFEYEGQSLAEIAEIVAADTGTVKARLHRARERLRRVLAPWLGRPTEGERSEPTTGTPAAGDAETRRRRPVERMA
jgi:RNA polymerase sigma-70 factor (ECF subfamily)